MDEPAWARPASELLPQNTITWKSLKYFIGKDARLAVRSLRSYLCVQNRRLSDHKERVNEGSQNHTHDLSGYHMGLPRLERLDARLP